MPHSLGGAIAAVLVGILLVAWIAGLATGIVSTLLYWLGVALIVIGLIVGVKALIDGRGRTRSHL
jgi:hypothetical protein